MVKRRESSPLWQNRNIVFQRTFASLQLFCVTLLTKFLCLLSEAVMILIVGKQKKLLQKQAFRIIDD